MAAGPRERLSALIRDVEKAAKQLRTDIRKRAQGAPKNLEQAANRLRKAAADIAGQVEKYVHEIRVGLEGGGKKAAKPAARKRKGRPRRRTA